MSGFTQSRAVETKAWTILSPYLKEQSDGRLVVTNKGTLARWLQSEVGDVLMNVGIDETLFSVELKAEEKHTGNLFLEVWSNRNLDDRGRHVEHGSNSGWMFKLRADLVFFYFLDVDTLYCIDVFSLKRWAFGYTTKAGDVRGEQISRFIQKRQSKYNQLNDTWGACVPVQILYDELPSKAMKQTSVRRRELANI